MDFMLSKNHVTTETQIASASGFPKGISDEKGLIRRVNVTSYR